MIFNVQVKITEKSLLLRFHLVGDVLEHVSIVHIVARLPLLRRVMRLLRHKLLAQLVGLALLALHHWLAACLQQMHSFAT